MTPNIYSYRQGQRVVLIYGTLATVLSSFRSPFRGPCYRVRHQAGQELTVAQDEVRGPAYYKPGEVRVLALRPLYRPRPSA